MITTEDEVRVYFSTRREDHTFIMTDGRLQPIAGLYYAYPDSALYDAAYLERTDTYCPLTFTDPPEPFIGGSVESIDRAE